MAQSKNCAFCDSPSEKGSRAQYRIPCFKASGPASKSSRTSDKVHKHPSHVFRGTDGKNSNRANNQRLNCHDNFRDRGVNSNLTRKVVEPPHTVTVNCKERVFHIQGNCTATAVHQDQMSRPQSHGFRGHPPHGSIQCALQNVAVFLVQNLDVIATIASHLRLFYQQLMTLSKQETRETIECSTPKRHLPGCRRHVCLRLCWFSAIVKCKEIRVRG